MSDKISKKASTDIISFVKAIDPQASKLTSYDEAWEIIAEYGGLIGDLKTKSVRQGPTTTFTLYKENGSELKNIHEFVWENKEVFDKGDWDWTIIYKEVCEYIIKNKLVKKPRAKRQSKKSK